MTSWPDGAQATRAVRPLLPGVGRGVRSDREAAPHALDFKETQAGGSHHRDVVAKAASVTAM